VRRWRRLPAVRSKAHYPKVPDARLLARGGGYVLDVAADVIDAIRFEQLAVAAKVALGGGEAAVAGSRFREALGLWRGPALADVSDVEALGREAARLEDLRSAGWDSGAAGAALVAGISALEERAPGVVLVADDVHWADLPSARALLFLRFARRSVRQRRDP
jgi:hypothetical protein